MFVKIVELCHLTYLKVQPVLDFRIVKFKLCKILIKKASNSHVFKIFKEKKKI